MSRAVERFVAGGTFPYGTLSVNVVGCFLFGLLAGVSDARGAPGLGAQMRLIAMVGVLGGFTTFSTFSYQTLVLFRDGDVGRALANVSASVALCLLFVWIGYAAGHR